MTDDPTRRLVDLLENPRETLDIELKGWLALANNNNHKALLAKAIIALANHGGGVVIIGFEETPDGVVPAGGRPDDLAMYTPDIINSIVTRYAEPSFHLEFVVKLPSGSWTSPRQCVCQRYCFRSASLFFGFTTDLCRCIAFE